MVASRKPKRSKGERRPGETLEQMFQRLLTDEDVERPLDFTVDEARFVTMRLWETGDPSEPNGEEMMREFYGDWSEDEPAG